jgi:Major Facilitator Superfamily
VLVRRIVAAYTINRLGTWFGFIALSLAVFDHTHSALAVAALLVVGQIIPAFATPALVARIEGSSKPGMLTGLYLFEAVATAALAALLSWSFSLAGVLVLVAFDATAALAASALLRTAAARCSREWVDAPRQLPGAPPEGLPAHTYAGRAGIGLTADEHAFDAEQRPEHDDRAGAGCAPEEIAIEAERRTNAALNVGFATTFVLGPVLAGLVVAAFGAPTALLIDTLSFAICGAMLADVGTHVPEADGTTVRERVRAAWEHLVAAPTLRALMVIEGVALVFFASDGSIEVPYAKVTLQAGDRGYGLIVTMWGVGVVAGSVVFARSVRRPLGTILSAGALAVGVAYLGWALAPTLALACVAGVIGGLGNGVQWAAFISAVQRLTPPELQGRMMGAVESLGAIFPAAGLALGGALVALSAPRDAFLVVGLGAAFSAIAFVRLRLGGLTSETREIAPGEFAPAWAQAARDPGDAPVSRATDAP